MTLQDLGYSEKLEQIRVEKGLESFDVGRVIIEHKDRYMVKNQTGEFEAELVGNLRFTAESRYDFPAVGDWVAISEFDVGKVLIHAIFPRQTIMERKAAGKAFKKQIIAANVDIGFIVQAVDRDYNINRLERYITICNEAHVKPIIVLSKVDLVNPTEVNEMIAKINQRIPGITVIPVSNQSSIGFDQLMATIEPGKTYCLLGSSGAASKGSSFT